jgi:hypothetical protein
MTQLATSLLWTFVVACTPRGADSGSVPDSGGVGDGGSAADGGGATDGGSDGGGAADGGSDSGSSDSGGLDTASTFCDEGPTITWANFGNGFLIENCNGCHAATAVNRFGAPEDITFDTVDEVWAWATIVLAVATGDKPSMPPTGGVVDDDRLRLEYWLRCAEKGT